MAKKTHLYFPINATIGTRRKYLALAISTVLLSACLDGPDHHDSTLEFGDEYWAEQAAGLPDYIGPPGQALAFGERINHGHWGEKVDWPLIAAGVANMPDGKITAWASFKKDTFKLTKEESDAEAIRRENGEPLLFDMSSTHGTIYDPTDNSFSEMFTSEHDMFCSGVSMLDDGTVFIAGGGATVSTTSIFNNGQFSEIDSMNQTRWYPSSTTLPTGQVLTALGNMSSPNPEVWTEDEGWKVLDNVSLQTLLDDDAYDYRDWYPALNVAPDGSVFHPGHLPELLSIDIDAEHDHSVHSHGDIAEGTESTLYNTTVMYDIGKMLVAGGGFGKYAKNDAGGRLVVDGVPVVDPTADHTTSAAYTIDINGSTPVVQNTSPLNHKRAMHNSVVLPDGKVFVVGGTSHGVQFSDFGSVHYPELWDPATGQWTELLAQNKEPRNYHSSAILLKDARVLVAGGGLCGTECSTNHQDGRIYSPPYLWNDADELIARPQILSGSAEAFPGESITLQGSDDIVSFNMLRLVALTHHHTTDQRMVPTTFEKTAAGQYRLDLNSSPNILIPGYYWVFGLNANGTPSEGHTVRVKLVTENIPVAPPGASSEKVNYEYFEIDEGATSLPNFDALTAVEEGQTTNFELSEALRANDFAMRFHSVITVPADGEYDFYLSSDNGSRLFINGALVVDANGNTTFESEEKTGTVQLAPGDHDIEVQFYQNEAGSALAVAWAGPGMTKRALSADYLSLPVEEVVIVEPENPVVVNPAGFVSTGTGAFNPVIQVLMLLMLLGVRGSNRPRLKQEQG